MNRYLAQRKRKAWLAATASGLIVLLVIGLGLLQDHAPTLALTEAQANATREEATWRAFATYAPDKATQRAMQQLTVTFLPTSTWFDGPATGQALDKMLTTSPTPGPTEPPPMYIQRPAGTGRLIGELRGICTNDHQCYALNHWIEKTQDKFIVVVASEQSDLTTGHTQARVRIEWWFLNDKHPGTPPRDVEVFPVPIPAESVMIVDAVGEQLTLRTEDGTLLVFDMPSRQYISLPPPQLTSRAQHQTETGTITERSDVPFTEPRFRTVNQWSGKNANGRLNIFAGGTQQDFRLGKGMLAIVTSKGEPTTADVPQVYYAPGLEAGALWVFDVKGNLITLIDWGGSEFFFDLAKRQFISEEEARPKLFTAPLFDPNMPISQATPAPVTPFIPPTLVSTPVPNAYP